MTRTMSIILTGRLSRPVFILAMGAVLLHADASPAKFSATESNVVAASVTTTPSGNTPGAGTPVTVRKKR
ncbi:MAG: hypothetical protein ACOYMT_09080, partial [Chthoniobacterales bacterium]